MDFLAQQLLWGAVLPASITLTVLVASWRAWRRDGVSTHWGTPLALSLGYLFAHWRIVGLPLRFPPVDSNEWLFAVAIALGFWGVIEHFACRQSLLGEAGRAVLAVTISWLVLRPLMGTLWQGMSAYIWWLLLALGWWLWWSLQARIASSIPGLPAPLVLSMVAGGGGFVLLWSNSSSLSQLSGAVAAVAGATVPLVLWRREGNIGAGGVAFIAGLLGFIWVNAIAFVPVPVWRIAMLAVASLTPCVALLPALKQKPGWNIVVMCAIATAILLSAVMVPTYRAYVASAGAYGY
ncbi:MAG: hypothetical protein RMM08_02335 [Armatimonadota bacterium]|nr:hypothetical protein [bacterium]MDW8320178.1 hypothetical protein [Armatimonadota bacterium]